MPRWRAASITSSIGSRSTSRLRWIGRPSWTMTIGTPLTTAAKRRERHVAYDSTVIQNANVDPASTAPVNE